MNLVAIICDINLVNAGALDCTCKSQKAMLLGGLALELALVLLLILLLKAVMLITVLNAGIKIYAHVLKAHKHMLNVL